MNYAATHLKKLTLGLFARDATLILNSILYLDHETNLVFSNRYFIFEKSGAHILVIKAPNVRISFLYQRLVDQKKGL